MTEPGPVDPEDAWRCTAVFGQWRCVRLRYHAGRHSAGDGGTVSGATWGGNAPPIVAPNTPTTGDTDRA